MSRFITRNKGEYYRLLQAIRSKGTDNYTQWEEWILFMLKGVEVTAQDTIMLVNEIGALMTEYKNILRPEFGAKYNHELLNGLFYHPYTKIDHVASNLEVSRQTAAKYLDRIVDLGLLKKERSGKDNYYINTRLKNNLPPLQLLSANHHAVGDEGLTVGEFYDGVGVLLFGGNACGSYL